VLDRGPPHVEVDDADPTAGMVAAGAGVGTAADASRA
jgi:hypothetical protein